MYSLKDVVDIDNFVVKTGDVKVNSMDLMNLFKIINTYKELLLSKELTQDQVKGVESLTKEVDKYQAKYVFIGDLRRQENLWFTLVKKIDYIQVDQNTKPALQELSLAFFMDYIKEGISKGISIDQATKLLEVAVLNFEREEVRRALWGEYISCKSKKENILKEVNHTVKTHDLVK